MVTTISPAVPSVHPNVGARYIVRVVVVGEIDLSSSDELRVRLFDVLSALRPRHIEVDLDGVTFLDCSGLTVLVVLRRAAARAGCHLRITNPQPLVRRILDLTGLLDVLTAGPDQPSLAATTAHVIAPAGILVDLAPPGGPPVRAVAASAGGQFRSEGTWSPASSPAGLSGPAESVQP